MFGLSRKEKKQFDKLVAIARARAPPAGKLKIEEEPEEDPNFLENLQDPFYVEALKELNSEFSSGQVDTDPSDGIRHNARDMSAWDSLLRQQGQSATSTLENTTRARRILEEKSVASSPKEEYLTTKDSYLEFQDSSFQIKELEYSVKPYGGVSKNRVAQQTVVFQDSVLKNPLYQSKLQTVDVSYRPFDGLFDIAVTIRVPDEDGTYYVWELKKIGWRVSPEILVSPEFEKLFFEKIDALVKLEPKLNTKKQEEDVCIAYGTFIPLEFVDTDTPGPNNEKWSPNE